MDMELLKVSQRMKSYTKGMWRLGSRHDRRFAACAPPAVCCLQVGDGARGGEPAAEDEVLEGDVLRAPRVAGDGLLRHEAGLGMLAAAGFMAQEAVTGKA